MDKVISSYQIIDRHMARGDSLLNKAPQLFQFIIKPHFILFLSFGN
jgi:hypothetical protein